MLTVAYAHMYHIPDAQITLKSFGAPVSFKPNLAGDQATTAYCTVVKLDPHLLWFGYPDAFKPTKASHAETTTYCTVG